MYTNCSTEFRRKAVDGQTLQNVILNFGDYFLSGMDGDFTSSGVVFNNYFCTKTDISYGEAPSDTLSFSIFNEDRALSALNFGEAQASFGVQISVEDFTMPDGCFAHIEYDDHVVEGKEDGLYVDGSKVALDGVSVYGLIAEDGAVVAIGDGDSVVYDFGAETASVYLPNRFMVQKVGTGYSAVFDEHTATYWYADSVEVWEHIPMGAYLVEKPEQSNADIITVSDARDRMRLFDADASEFLESLEFPLTIGEIYTALCDYVGVPYETDEFYRSDFEIIESPVSNTSCTLRTILKWIAESAFSIAHFDRVGTLQLFWVGSSVAETITANNVDWNHASFGEYETEAVTNCILKDTSGATVTFSEGDNPYLIYGNPLIYTIGAEDLDKLRSTPRIVPLSVQIIYPQPCTDIGDLISVMNLPDEHIALTDVYNQAFIDELNRMLTMKNAPYIVPLMQRTLSWNGWLYGKYEATGNKVRANDVDLGLYNASISFEKQINKALTPQEVFNKLTNNGEIQGLYMRDGQIFINAEFIKAGILEGIRIIAEQGEIAGWSILQEALSKSGSYDLTGLDSTTMAYISAYLLGRVSLEEAIEHGADINGDGLVDYLDLTLYIVTAFNYIARTGNFVSRLTTENGFSSFSTIVDGETTFSGGIHGVFGKNGIFNRIELYEGIGSSFPRGYISLNGVNIPFYNSSDTYLGYMYWGYSGFSVGYNSRAARTIIPYQQNATNSGSSGSGWLEVLSITIPDTATYMNATVSFHIGGRVTDLDCKIAFTNASTAASANVSTFTASGIRGTANQRVMVKRTSYTAGFGASFAVYIEVSGTYYAATVDDIRVSFYALQAGVDAIPQNVYSSYLDTSGAVFAYINAPAEQLVRLASRQGASYAGTAVTGGLAQYKYFVLEACRGAGNGVMATTIIPLEIARNCTSDSVCSWVYSAQNGTYAGQCYFNFSNNYVYLAATTNSDNQVRIYGAI